MIAMDRRPKQKAPKGASASKSAATEADRITDPRFANIQTSALYRIPSKKHTHVPLDARFAHMLRDERFTSHAKVDRYGRKIRSGKGKKELERLYRVEKKSKATGSDPDGVAEEDVDDDQEVQAELARVEKAYDPARDGGFAESSSEEESSDDEQLEFAEEEVEFLDQAAADAPEGEVSRRLAIVNLDWDNIRAVDLMAVLSSFVPKGGHLSKVVVYPSEFGKERIERENLEGPPKEIFANSLQAVDAKDSSAKQDADSSGDEDEDEDEDERIKKSLVKGDETEEYNSTQLRRYQLERLRYYYAVVDCSSPECAKEIYDAIDGREYLSSANFFDLRFIPDGMDFSGDEPRDECDKIPDRYRPKEFVTDALQHSKVKLSWDAEDTERKDAQKRAFSGSRAEIDENDLKAYLASDSSDEGEAEEQSETQEASAGNDPKLSKKERERERMRKLLGLSEMQESWNAEKSKAPVGDMQVTFTSGLADSKAKEPVADESDQEETTIAKYARKEKERKNKRKEKFKAQHEGHKTNDAEADEAEKEDLGFDDPFFTAPEQDRDAAAASRKEAKRKKRAEREEEDARAESQRAELELLVTDDHDAAGGNMTHFDMQDLAKGEKALRKKKMHKGKMSAREQQALEAKRSDQFAMNVADPRFQAVYERNEFAVDPSHPKFKGTDGMQALLHEHRRKRVHGESAPDAEEDEERPAKKKGGKEKKADGEDKGDLSNLIARVKTKNRR